MWFDDLKKVLGDHYSSNHPADVVGYLRGSKQPGVWRVMENAGRGQMIVLGNRPPTEKEWTAAGVNQRSDQHAIAVTDLAGFRLLYGGFMYRPWGIIVPDYAEADRYWPSQLQSWTRNFMPPT
ncbi:hypothetical protein ACVDG3_13725 [Meridianimarinicoccus sp. RP-17]|uniref:hypothetical protein n=1 Tax=Meridianimarinicoccus zhengii TaxID=2056810 RepID=UPI000DACA3FC|nr:hypothetical protein [Phycocomes zhengii]